MAPRNKRPKPLRVVAATTPAELKEQFARNLDGLLQLVGLSRKEAAEEIGVSYKLVRRLASAGVSRIDERNKESLSKIAGFFSLPRIDDLWLQNLIPWLLQSDEGQPFVKKFQSELQRFREEQTRNIEHVDRSQLQLIGEALHGKSQPDDEAAMAAYLERVRTILESDRAEQFESLIDDYFELVTGGRAASTA
jgi:hypothetical protein